MLCHIYRSPRRRNTYLYLGQRDAFDALPQALMDSFGAPEFAVSFDLHDGRVLAQADASAVREALSSQGYYLQLPPPESTVPVPDFMQH
jgi:uncharacterized protein YcgL (UPF0745 family)